MTHLPMIVLDGDWKIEHSNEAFWSALGLPRARQKVSLFELGDGHWNVATLRTRLEDMQQRGGEPEGFTVEHPGDSGKTLRVLGRMIPSRNLVPGAMVVAFEDMG